MKNVVVKNVVEGRNRARLENAKKRIKAKQSRAKGGMKSSNAVVRHAQETAKRAKRPMIPSNPVARHALAARAKSRRG